MEEYRKRLLEHLTPINSLHEHCNMQYVPMDMFDKEVELIADYSEDSYQGVSYALYKFDGKWFTVESSFGSCSGCDPWMSDTEEEHEKTVHTMVSEVEAVANLWEIPINKYCDPDWRKVVHKLMEKEGCLQQFEAHQLECEEKEIETQRKQMEEESKRIEETIKRNEEEALKHTQFLETSLSEVLAHFHDKENWPLPFDEKAFETSTELRQLRWCCSQLTNPTSPNQHDVKKRAQSILEVYTSNKRHRNCIHFMGAFSEKQVFTTYRTYSKGRTDLLRTTVEELQRTMATIPPGHVLGKTVLIEGEYWLVTFEEF